MDLSDLISPYGLVERIANALPEAARGNVIIIGSLAAGYHYFSDDASQGIRTKDVDSMFSPFSESVIVATEVTEQLFDAGWTMKEGGDWSTPGTAATEDDKLPLVRLVPPNREDGEQWFLELLGAPNLDDDGDAMKVNTRVETKHGHFSLCSFRYLALTEWNPTVSAHQVRIAKPQMMALANLLHHPMIREDLISGTDVKRSNKDLGRVVALATLEMQKFGLEHFEGWAADMASALRETFPTRAARLAADAGSGLKALISSPGDLAQAYGNASQGLLASSGVSYDVFRANAHRAIQFVIDPLARAFPEAQESLN